MSDTIIIMLDKHEKYGFPWAMTDKAWRDMTTRDMEAWLMDLGLSASSAEEQVHKLRIWRQKEEI